MANILLTGATGFIGSHTWVALQQAGYRIVGLDNFTNSSPLVLKRLESLIGAVVFYEADVRDTQKVAAILTSEKIDAVIHFAALKSVGESVSQPIEYYNNNINGLISLLTAMQQARCFKIVFSSSATVYGNPQSVPIFETADTQATNPYGQTKLMCETILKDVLASDPIWQSIILRYFNPVGAHSSGTIGEDPRGIPNNLMPYIAQVAVGKRAFLSVFGDDYDTIDGTGVRDYIHVSDLAQGHRAAVDYALTHSDSHVINLGTGNGYSVLQVLQAYEKASGKSIPYKIVPRRAGDIGSCYANCDKAKALLGWQAQYDLSQMCADSWHWQKNNPDGFGA